MISGPIKNLLLLALLAMLPANAPAAAAEIRIDALMSLLAARKESRAAFHEVKNVAELSAPLVSDGQLLYVAPAHLEKRTLAPNPETLIVDGSMLTLQRPAEHVDRSLRLDQQPEIAALVESIRGTLAGDLAALQRHYSVGLDGSAEHWRLTLVPTERRVASFLKFVRLEGAGDQIRAVETVEVGGDTSRMTIEPAPQ
jgi:hypothetical protein